MLFDYADFIEKLRNSEKKEIVEEYEEFVSKLKDNVKQEPWYVEYVSYFEAIAYKVPEELQQEFDWELLIQLVASSFSSQITLLFDNEGNITPDIHVTNADSFVTKKPSELWSFQIMRLYEIYIEEQMNLQILLSKEPQERDAVHSHRATLLNKWRADLVKIKAELEMKKLLDEI